MFLIIGWDGWHHLVYEVENEEELRKEVEDGSFDEDTKIYEAKLYGIIGENPKTYIIVKEDK